MIHAAKRQGILAAFIVVAALATASPGAAGPTLASKEAEAQRVLGQIGALDADLSRAVEAYNAAQVRLDEIRAEQRTNRRHLKIARANVAHSQTALQKRLLALYTSSDATVVEILLGAQSLDDFLNRVDTVNRVSEQDARLVRELRAFRAEVRRREKELERAREEQARVVDERAARRADIEGQLAERRRLLESIKGEIARIRAAEAARQRRLEAQARRRLAQSRPSSSADQGATEASSSGTTAGPATGSSGASSGEPATATPPAQYGGVVAIAMRYLGIPYRWGGASPSTGFDCSGFIMYVYAQVGVSLPHSAAAQYGYGSPVSRSQLQPGDLVFFNGLGHNGIYIGGGQFIHSPHTGDVVKISSLSDSWYASTWVGGRRL